eukprot:COSAG05_NODE_57_length_23291_cov_75.862668_46_plen_79_part_00
MHNARIHMEYFVGKSVRRINLLVCWKGSTSEKLAEISCRPVYAKAMRQVRIIIYATAIALARHTVCFHSIGNLETMHD